MQELKVGIVGCGNLGRTHALCLSQLPDVRIAAYCDVHEPSAQALLQQFGGDYATAGLERLLEDPELDALYIATRHDTHADYCIRGLEAGKHVLVEKPLAMSLEDCLRIGQAVERSGKKLFTAFKMRYYDMLWKAKELMPEPQVITMQMMDDRWGEGIWANDPVLGGGNVLSQGCHSADILRFMAGSDPVEVYAAGGNYYQSSGVIDNLAAVFRFKNGAAGNLVQGDCGCPPLASKFFMQMFAEHRSLTLSDRFTTLTYQENGKPPVIYHGSETGFMEENKAFIHCLRHNEEPAINHIDGLYATLMILQAIKSLTSNKPEPVESLVDQAISLIHTAP